MNVTQAKKLAQELEDTGFETTVQDNYSGRGMYGKTTAAIVTDAPLTMIGYCWAKLEEWEDEEQFSDLRDMPTRTDNMGLSTVIY